MPAPRLAQDPIKLLPIYPSWALLENGWKMEEWTSPLILQDSSIIELEIFECDLIKTFLPIYIGPFRIVKDSILAVGSTITGPFSSFMTTSLAVSYTHLRAHET